MLNERQLAAVRHSAGPVAVLAGPGTGKTRVIIHRVERLINEGIPAESIVALTFTVKAAAQLRERLAELVGPGAADRVHAYTFHGFGWRLIRRFRDMLGLPSELRIVDGPRVRRLMREMIVAHNLYPMLEAAGRGSAVADATATIHMLSNNGLFPADAASFAASWAARLDGPDHGLDAEALAAARVRCARFAQDAALYGHFSRECAKRGWVTFDDLILLPIRLLREKEAAAALCRDDYRHFVVDEFQDVNAAQIELLRLLAPPGRGSCDLCVVGDDDQSIYEFRGADDRAFAKFERIWGLTPGDRITLTENYRSQRPIIEVANSIMQRAEVRFAPEKVVELPVAARDRAPSPGSAVECITLDDDGAAGETIAAMILQDRAARGVSWDEYAVVIRLNIDVERIATALALEGIPIRRVRGGSAMDDAGVRDVLAWMNILALPPGDAAEPLQTRWLLTRPPLSAPAARLAELTRRYVEERASRNLRGEGRPPGFLDWLVMHHAEDAGAGPAIRRMAALRDELRTDTARLSADAALFEIIRKSDVAHAELLPGRARAARISNLTALLRFARESLDALDPPADLAAFLSFFGELNDDERALHGDPVERLDSTEAEPEDERKPAVTLLTAHTAKGLEFDTVFVPRVRPGGFPQAARDDEEPPEGLIDRAGDTRPLKARRAAEERRLFYVAATRAERRLVLLAKKKATKTKTVDYFSELTLDPPGRGIVVPRTGAEVLLAAAEAGVRTASGSESLLVPGSADALNHARAGARLLAAQALDTVEDRAATVQGIERATAVLREAAQRIAIAAAVRQTKKAPGWVKGTGLEEFAARLEAGAALEDEGLAALIRPLTGPRELSYSWIEEYERCPRCFYFRRILKVPEPAGGPQSVGQVAHDALAEFYRRRMAAEADGRPGPTLADLLAFARERFLASPAAHDASGPEQLRQVNAQLTLAHGSLCSDSDEVHSVEEAIKFPFPVEDGKGGTVHHRVVARIDRLDRLPGPAAGHRIVDYKTGEAWGKLREPKGDDLQLGLYAMAVRWLQDGGVRDDADAAAALLHPAVGTAEYWILSTGERGIIDLADINYQKIRDRVAEAVQGMMRGEFEAAEVGKGGCWELCRAFARGPLHS